MTTQSLSEFNGNRQPYCCCCSENSISYGDDYDDVGGGDEPEAAG